MICKLLRYHKFLIASINFPSRNLRWSMILSRILPNEILSSKVTNFYLRHGKYCSLLKLSCVEIGNDQRRTSHGQICKRGCRGCPFPFSDLTTNKRRPALVVASLIGDDVILCQITSKTVSDPYAIGLSDSDLTTGNLHQESNIRPNRLFTADSKIIIYKAGTLKPEKLKEVVTRLIDIINSKNPA